MPWTKYPRGYLLNNVFEAWIALAVAISGFVNLISGDVRDASSASIELGHSLVWVWSALYAISGTVVLVSLLYQSLRWEVAGLSLFVVAVGVNSVALLSARGLIAVSSSVIFASLFGAGVVRVLGLWRLYHEVTSRRADARRIR